MPATKTHLHFLALASAVAFSLSGCYMPSPASHAQLLVAANGAYTLDGVPVPAERLQTNVAAIRAPVKSLVVQIRPSPQASEASIRLAVAAVRQADARVSFFGEEVAPQ